MELPEESEERGICSYTEMLKVVISLVPAFVLQNNLVVSQFET